MKKLLTLSLATLIAVAAMAQQLRSPSIQIKDIGKEEKPVRISNLKIDVEIVGSLAVTTVDMIFFNPNNRVMEGELQFPLADGQSISRYALDINGKLREGVVVEKAKGQEAFESIVRRGVDPGLLEKTEGNNFRTRVYPLIANGTRRVVIAYEQELIPDGDKFRFVLPVQYQDVLDNFDLKMTFFSDTEKPDIDESPWGNFAFDKADKSYIAAFSKKDYRTNGQIVVSVPVKKDINTFVEKGKISGQQVFYTQMFPDVKLTEKKLPETIALFWDASLSRSKRDTFMESDLLKGYFEKIKNLTVQLYTFNIKENKPQTFIIKDGNWVEVKFALVNTPYDGATQLGALDFSKVKADEILLFSDGMSNLGKKTPTLGNIPIITVNSTLSADYSMLRDISNRTGGTFINLMQQTVDEALTLLTTQTLRLMSVDYNKDEIEDLTTSGSIIDPKKGVSVAGRIKGDKAQLSISLGIGNEIQKKYDIVLYDSDKPSQYGNMVERLWAAKRIAELDMMYDQNKEEIELLGRTYNIVTRNTSLIVLEDVSDYVRFKIAPPEELKDEYNKIMGRQIRERNLNSDYQISWALKKFDRRFNWWNEIFPSQIPTKYENPQLPRRTAKTRRSVESRIANERELDIQGIVKDQNGDIMDDVNVQIIGIKSIWLYTNPSGIFQVKAYKGETIEVSKYGYITQKITVTDDQNLEIILKKEVKEVFSQKLFKMQGTVKNKEGNPLQGVSVAAEGTTVTTKANGEFIIEAHYNEFVEFKHAGYTSRNITVSGNKTIDVIMETADNTVSDEFTIRGTVKDTYPEMLIGVSITVKGKPELKTITNPEGEFTIKAANNDILVFSYIGFKTREVTVIGNQTLEVIMQENKDASINEIVITGTGRQKKISIVGAITSVDPSTLRTPKEGISNALAGNVAGVMAMQTSGQPGSNTAEFWVRGISTFGADSKALVLVDGFEVNDISTISPEDIESFSVLKDISSTAVYGSKGANGVVLVTTKKKAKDAPAPILVDGEEVSSMNEVEISEIDTYTVVRGEEAEALCGERGKNGVVVITTKKGKGKEDQIPDIPYMDELRGKSNKELYIAYLVLRNNKPALYKESTAFYLDVAALFEERKMKDETFLVLSNLAEIKNEDYRALRVLAHRFKQLGYNEYAIGLFRRILQLRPEEPQSYRDLGLALAQNKEYQEAIELMYKIADERWDRRFGDIEVFALEEMNNMIYKAQREGVELYLGKIDERAIFNMPVDIRVVLNWDTDNSDMDLWVTDPDGEKCYYKNKLTKMGGMISEDYTGGYGPEEFLIRKAKKGKYTIHANFYDTREQTLVGPTTIYLEIYTHYGTPKETKKTITLRLTKKEDEVKIGEIVF